MSEPLITLNDSWRLEMDKLNFILAERMENQKTGEVYYQSRSFYGTLDGALHAALHRELVDEGKAKGVKALLDRVNRLAEEYGRKRIAAHKKLPQAQAQVNAPQEPKEAPKAPQAAPVATKKKKKRSPSRANA